MINSFCLIFVNVFQGKLTRNSFISVNKKICSYLETSNYLFKIQQTDMIKKVLSENESIKHIYYLNTSMDEKNEKCIQILHEGYIKSMLGL